MKRKFLHGLAFVAIILAFGLRETAGADLKTRNVFLITSDGLRWQELFSGAEEMLISKEIGGVANTNRIREKYWRATPEARREALMPFFWSELARKGQLFGNQAKGSILNVANKKNFSYPGYNEILTGYGDPRIDSNSKTPNPNITVFEWIERQKGFRGKVAVIGTWDVFPYIFNGQRSGLPIWPTWGAPQMNEIEVSDVVAKLRRDTPELAAGVIYDSFAMHATFDYVKREKPRLAFVGLGETDEWAHHARSDEYLDAAFRVDRFVREFWEMLQGMSQYRDKTTLIITADHGRGTGKENWKHHGEKIEGSESDWLVVIGPDTAPLGERSQTNHSASQFAATVAAFLGLDYRSFFSQAGEPISEIIGKK